MSELFKKKCSPCNGETPPLKLNAIKKYIKQVPSWIVSKNEKGYFIIKKKIKLKNFKESLNFVKKVAKISESQNHHPDIKFGWGYFEIVIFTHAAKGLTESDFILASKIDKLNV